MEIVVRFDNGRQHQTMLERMRVVEAVQQAAESNPEVGGTMSAVTFCPDLERRGRRLRGRLLSGSAPMNAC